MVVTARSILAAVAGVSLTCLMSSTAAATTRYIGNTAGEDAYFVADMTVLPASGQVRDVVHLSVPRVAVSAASGSSGVPESATGGMLLAGLGLLGMIARRRTVLH